jgi:phosphotransferase system  glucose/maltose/N-acetylglucosamine-specific IIC component
MWSEVIVALCNSCTDVIQVIVGQHCIPVMTSLPIVAQRVHQDLMMEAASTSETLVNFWLHCATSQMTVVFSCLIKLFLRCLLVRRNKRKRREGRKIVLRPVFTCIVLVFVVCSVVHPWFGCISSSSKLRSELESQKYKSDSCQIYKKLNIPMTIEGLHFVWMFIMKYMICNLDVISRSGSER